MEEEEEQEGRTGSGGGRIKKDEEEEEEMVEDKEEKRREGEEVGGYLRRRTNATAMTATVALRTSYSGNNVEHEKRACERCYRVGWTPQLFSFLFFTRLDRAARNEGGPRTGTYRQFHTVSL